MNTRHNAWNKERIGKRCTGEMYVYLQPPAKLCCIALPDVLLYQKSH